MESMIQELFNKNIFDQADKIERSENRQELKITIGDDIIEYEIRWSMFTPNFNVLVNGFPWVYNHIVDDTLRDNYAKVWRYALHRIFELEEKEQEENKKHIQALFDRLNGK